MGPRSWNTSMPNFLIGLLSVSLITLAQYILQYINELIALVPTEEVGEFSYWSSFDEEFRGLNMGLKSASAYYEVYIILWVFICNTIVDKHK